MPECCVDPVGINGMTDRVGGRGGGGGGGWERERGREGGREGRRLSYLTQLCSALYPSCAGNVAPVS